MLSTMRTSTLSRRLFSVAPHVMPAGATAADQNRGPVAAATELAFKVGPKAAAPTIPVAIKGRMYLPDRFNPELPDVLAAPRETFPHVKLPTRTDVPVKELADLARDTLDAELHKHGAILFRGLPMKTHEEFTEFVVGLGWRTKDTSAYLKSMNARSMTSTAVSDHVRTASDDPPEYTIEPHCEYHTVGCPPRIMLYCVTPPLPGGGEWPVSDNRQIYKDIDPAVREKFEKLGVQYKVFYESQENAIYNCWQGNVAPTRELVEEYLEMTDYEWSWDDKGALTYWKTIPAVSPHPVTGEPCWFNQFNAHHHTFYKDCHPKYVHADLPEGFNRWPVDAFYGDGTEVEKEVRDHIRGVVWKNTVAVTPTKGDLLFCDNYLAMHGRMGFKSGTPREIYVAMSYD